MRISQYKRNNTHIVWDYSEWVGEHTHYETSHLFQTVYYSKIDNSGNILIKEKIIDSDWMLLKKDILILIVIAICAILVILVIAHLIIWCRRKT